MEPFLFALGAAVRADKHAAVPSPGDFTAKYGTLSPFMEMPQHIRPSCLSRHEPLWQGQNGVTYRATCRERVGDDIHWYVQPLGPYRHVLLGVGWSVPCHCLAASTRAPCHGPMPWDGPAFS